MVKLIDYLMQKTKMKKDEAAEIRDELRAEIKESKRDIERLRMEVDDWKGKYWRMYEGYNELKVKLFGIDKELKSK